MLCVGVKEKNTRQVTEENLKKTNDCSYRSVLRRGCLFVCLCVCVSVSMSELPRKLQDNAVFRLCSAFTCFRVVLAAASPAVSPWFGLVL